MNRPLKTLFLSFLAGALVLSLVYGLWTWVLQPSFRQEQLRVVSSRLKEVNPRSVIATAEGLYSFVYPFDFFPRDTDWGGLLFRNMGGNLSDGDKKLVRFFELGKGLGLDMRGLRKFAVIQVQAQGGFDFEAHPLEGQWKNDEKGGHLLIRLPPVTFTRFVFRDGYREGVNYPELAVTPGQWAEVLKELKPLIEERVRERGLLERAKIHGTQFFTEFFKMGNLGPFVLEYQEEPNPAPVPKAGP